MPTTLEPTDLELVARLVLAAFLGSLIGWEREAGGKPAGLRTIALVSLAAATYVVGGQWAALQHGEPFDSVRAMAGVAQGVGFLGAGLFIRARGEGRWLTTAATVWAAAAVGLAVGLGAYLVAVAGVALILAILVLLQSVEDRVFGSRTKPKRGKARANNGPTPPTIEGGGQGPSATEE